MDTRLTEGAEHITQRGAMDANRKFKPVKVQSVAVVGKVAKKLGCFSQRERELFVDHVLKKVSKKEFLKFKAEFADTQEELDEFREKLESCETALKF